MSAEQEVKDWCTAYYSQKYTDGKSAAQNWDKNYADEKVWVIRPSGNPLSKESWSAMWKTGDLTDHSFELLSIENLRVFAGGKAAFVVCKSREKFKYKGAQQDDVTNTSFVLEKKGSEWKCVGAQRATGQKPSA